MMANPSIPYRVPPAKYVVMILLLAIGAWVSWNYREFSFDDPWITYRIAENIIAGKGFVYNTGENVLVTTTPLYTLLLAALGFVLGDVPLLSFIIGAASYTGTAVLLFVIANKKGLPWVGCLAGMLYLLFPLLPLTLPMETPFLVMLCTLAMYLALSSRWSLAAATLAMAVVTRPDAAIFVGMLMIFNVFQYRRFPVWQSITFLAISAPWFAFSQSFFGSPFTATLAAKQASLASGWAAPFLEGSFQWGQGVMAENPLYWLLLPSTLSGMVFALKRDRWVLLPVSWAALHALAYQMLGIPWFPWYMAPFFPAISLLAACGLAWLRVPNPSAGSGGRTALPVLVGVILASILIAPWGQRMQSEGTPGLDPLHSAYREVGTWLKGNAAAEATVGSTEFGIIGYYSGLRMEDFPGLTNHQQSVAISRKDALWSLFNTWPEYVVLFDGPAFDENLKVEPRFQGNYTPLRSFPVGGPIVPSITVYGLWKILGKPEVVQEGLAWDFGGSFQLRGLAIDHRSLRPNEVLKLALTWRPLKASSHEYSFFAHVLDANNRMVTQQDNLLETTTWRPGSKYQDQHTIHIPAGLAPGPYSLQVGVYRADTMENLPVLVDGKAETTSLAIATIEVLPAR